MMNKYPTNPEMEKLGENFFVEEHKHSLAFERYLQMFADKVNVSYEELRDLLPVFNESKIEELFRVNSLAGGNAMWWVVAAVEEESIRVFQALSPYKKDLDPLFFDLHKKHFLEESRHAGYAFLMLELYKERAKSPINTVFKKMDFLFSEVMQITWMFGQLAKVRKIEALRHRHPFFETLSRLVPRLEQQRPWEIVETLFKDAPYISLILNPLKNKNLKKAKEAYNALSMKRPESWQEEIA